LWPGRRIDGPAPGSLGLELVDERRGDAEAACERGAIDRRRVEQDLAKRPLVKMDVGQELASADQSSWSLS
jgi:hypothetical protein